MNIHSILGAFAIVLTILAFFPYVLSIHRGKTKPHVFSWVIWGMVTCAVAVAQWLDGGGAGAWPILISGLITFYVALIAFIYRADIRITRIDWFFLFSALFGLGLWVWLQDALYTVIILTFIDLCGFAPTFRKGWHAPREENSGFFAIMAVRNILAATALEHYSFTTLFFPIATCLACVMLFAMLHWRRASRVNV